MKTTTAYRRISSWPEERFCGLADSPVAWCFHENFNVEGVRWRPLFMAAAASLSGGLPHAQSDNDLLACAVKYGLMIQSGLTSCQELKDEIAAILDELNSAGLPEHQLN